MLLTRSLPPQFLLPSWTGAELALAVQRSFLSTTSTKRVYIRKHATSKGPPFQKNRHLSPGSEPATEVRRRRDAGSPHSQNPDPGSCHFNAPRPIPVASSAFYIGKKYGVPTAQTDRPDISYTPRESHEARNMTERQGDNPRSSMRGQDRTQQLSLREGTSNKQNHLKTSRNRGQRMGKWGWKPVEGGEKMIATDVFGSAKDPVEDPISKLASATITSAAGHLTSNHIHPLPKESEGPSPSAPAVKTSKAMATKPLPPRSKLAERKTAPQQSLSLFEELFPEELNIRSEAIRLAEDRLEKLPAFAWELNTELEETVRVVREKKREKFQIIPKREDTRSISRNNGFITLAQHVQTQKQDAVKDHRHEPSVVVLSGVSKTLEESDFFRLGPRGNHIEGWTSGILKVIPARDHITLQPLGYYYLYFSNDAAARAYMDNTRRLHSLSKSTGSSSVSSMPPPPGSLKEGEDTKELLRGFSIVPRQNRLSMHLLDRPYQPHILELFREGGPPALASRSSKGEALVLFSVDMAFVTYYDILFAIKDDGRRRNMHWRFAGGKETDITNITFEKDAKKGMKEGVKDNARKSQGDKPQKYILAMKDMQEARRFVREWHCRPMEVANRKAHHGDLGQEKSAIVHAELLW